MRNYIDTFWIVLGTIVYGNLIFYWIPYLIRKGWGDAENKTKKVCDMCFRDIKKFNEYCKKNNVKS